MDEVHMTIISILKESLINVFSRNDILKGLAHKK